MEHYMWMSPASHSTWKPKRANWRQRFGYRQESICRPQHEGDIKRQTAAYVEWLATSRGISEEDAKVYAYSQKHGELIASTAIVESRACITESLGHGVAIRTVKSWAGGKHYGNPPAGKTSYWHQVDWYAVPKGEGQTHYRVMVDGRMIDSCLSKARARAKAETIADERGRSSRAMMPELAA